jgi:hypothetical protein
MTVMIYRFQVYSNLIFTTLKSGDKLKIIITPSNSALAHRTVSTGLDNLNFVATSSAFHFPVLANAMTSNIEDVFSLRTVRKQTSR